MKFFSFRRTKRVFIRSGLVTLAFYAVWASSAQTRAHITPATRNMFLILVGYGLFVHPLLVMGFKGLGKLFQGEQDKAFSGPMFRGTEISGFLRKAVFALNLSKNEAGKNDEDADHDFGFLDRSETEEQHSPVYAYLIDNIWHNTNQDITSSDFL